MPFLIFHSVSRNFVSKMASTDNSQSLKWRGRIFIFFVYLHNTTWLATIVSMCFASFFDSLRAPKTQKWQYMWYFSNIWHFQVVKHSWHKILSCNLFSSRGVRTQRILQKSTLRLWRFTHVLLGCFQNEFSRNNAKYQERHAAKNLQKLICVL